MNGNEIAPVSPCVSARIFFYRCMNFWPILILIGAGLYATLPFLSASAINYPGDGMAYRDYIYDAVVQFRHSVFPVYIGQTDYNFTGYPYFDRLGMFNFGPIIDFLTLGRLDPNLTTNILIVISSILAFLSCYFCLRVVAPRHPWSSAILALLFGLTPANLSMLYTHESIPTFVATPFIPPYFTATWLCFLDRRLRAPIVGGLSLSLMWMCHAPTAAWSMLICLVLMVGLAFRHWRRLPAAVLNFSIFHVTFGLVTAWYFVSYFSSGLEVYSLAVRKETSFFVSESRVLEMIRVAWESLPDAFLPVVVAHRQASVQLGYSILALLLGLVAALVRRRRYDGIPLLVTIAVCLIAVLPVPVLSHWLLGFIPNTASAITIQFNYQRVLRILAFLICFGVILYARDWLENCFSRWAGRVALGALIGWSLFQAGVFVHYTLTTGPSNEEGWQYYLPGGIISLPYNFTHQSDFWAINPATYDPALENRIITAGTGAVGADNKLGVVKACRAGTLARVPLVPGDPRCVGDSCRFKTGDSFPSTILYRFTLPPDAKVLMAFDLNSNIPWRPELDPRTTRTVNIIVSGPGYFMPAYINYTGLTTLPLVNRTSSPLPLTLTLASSSFDGEGDYLHLTDFCLASYRGSDLPVDLQPDIPFVARVHNSGLGDHLLTHRTFLAGYEATVDGKPVEIGPSPTNLLTIPIPQGDSTVTLAYKGTSAMGTSFIVSLLALAASLVIIALASRRRSARRTS